MSEERYGSAWRNYYEGAVFFKAVMDKLGKEKAMQLHEYSYATFGLGLESSLREQFPDGVELKPFVQGMVDGLKESGYSSELVVKGENRLIIRNSRCPRYEGMKQAGHSDETIKEHCLRGVRVIEKHLQRVDPGFRFNVPIWDAANGRCDEEFILRK
ncbi:hypothetical protein JXL21_06695 [Candidatus Bathyarchaeota archaeon]|nr:hypothetical protein [Candidatus Bathyarchaeota archaeon]